MHCKTLTTHQICGNCDPLSWKANSGVRFISSTNTFNCVGLNIVLRSRWEPKAMAAYLFLTIPSEMPRWLIKHIKEEELGEILDSIRDANLRHTLSFGIGLHHAGLSDGDRQIVEELFASNKIQASVKKRKRRETNYIIVDLSLHKYSCLGSELACTLSDHKRYRIFRRKNEKIYRLPYYGCSANDGSCRSSTIRHAGIVCSLYPFFSFHFHFFFLIFIII